MGRQCAWLHILRVAPHTVRQEVGILAGEARARPHASDDGPAKCRAVIGARVSCRARSGSEERCGGAGAPAALAGDGRPSHAMGGPDGGCAGSRLCGGPLEGCVSLGCAAARCSRTCPLPAPLAAFIAFLRLCLTPFRRCIAPTASIVRAAPLAGQAAETVSAHASSAALSRPESARMLLGLRGSRGGSQRKQLGNGGAHGPLLRILSQVVCSAAMAPVTSRVLACSISFGIACQC